MPTVTPWRAAASAMRLDGGAHFGGAQGAVDAARHRQVRRPDERHVDARNGQDVVQVVQRRGGFDLHHQQDFGIGVRVVYSSLATRLNPVWARHRLTPRSPCGG